MPISYIEQSSYKSGYYELFEYSDMISSASNQEAAMTYLWYALYSRNG